MKDQSAHITSLDPTTDAAVMGILDGFGQVMSGVKVMFGRSMEEKEQLRQQVESAQIAPSNMVAEGCQSDIIAILNAMYECGLIKGSKTEFMQRIANALGCPGIADYSKQLYKAKWTNKYSEIFRKLGEAAEREKTKDN